VPECEKVKSSVLDDVIKHVAEWQETSSAHEPSKLKLKESAWSEYDPCFTHVSEKTHQHALERRPKKSNISRPMCPDFHNLPAHPAFLAVRVCTLADPVLWTLVRDLLYASMIDRISPIGAGSALISGFPTASHPQHAYYRLQQEWTLRCSAAVFSKTLQLLTLMVHNISRPKNNGDGDGDTSAPCFLAGSQGDVPSVEQRQASFESFLLSPGRLLVKPKREMKKERPFTGGGSGDSTGVRLEAASPETLRTMEEFGIPTRMNFDFFPSEQPSLEQPNERMSEDKEGESKVDKREEEEEEGETPQETSVPLPPLLNTIMDIYDSLSITGTDEDIFNKQSLLWIIGKLEGTLSSKCAEVIEHRMKQELHETRRLEMKEKREKARERAMAAMKKNATAFAAHMEKEVSDVDGGVGDDGDGDDGDVGCTK
jgi:hypothetical protein